MLWLIPLLPVIAGVLLPLLRIEGRGSLGVAAFLTLAMSTGLTAGAVADGWTGSLQWSESIILSAELNPVSAAMAILVPVVALPVSVYAASHEEGGLTKLASLLLFFVGGMELLVVAADFVTLLIGWELVGFCSWALIGHKWHDDENVNSANYAFLMTRFGDLGLFLAAIATYAGTGSFAFSGLVELDGSLLGLVASGVLLSAAAKSGQVPFSPWLFRAMDGPTSVSALLHSATMVAAGAYLIARLHEPLSQLAWFGQFAILLGLVTAAAGGVVALLQAHAKKLLAASTSAHFGLMFVAVGAGYPAIALLHLIAHACFKAPLFLAAGIAGKRAGSFELARMRFGRVMPLTATLAGINALALAGVPPLGGAMTKEAIVGAAGHAHLVFAIAAIIAGGLSAIYAARFQFLTFGLSPKADVRMPARSEIAAMAYLALGSLLLSFLWVPDVKQEFLSLIEGDAPAVKSWEIAASIASVILGLVAGWLLASKRPALGQKPREAAAADWFGLPKLIDAGLVKPTLRAAERAAKLDDAEIDRLVRAATASFRASARALSLADRRAVDGGVRLSARSFEWLAEFFGHFGEFLTDGIPEGAARLVGRSGAEIPQMQTGRAHNYYALISAAVVFFILIAALGI